MADLTRKLPLELLAEILSHASAPDLLRLKLVSHTFHDAILASPLIQHKIDLFLTGLEYNAATEVSLADSKKALLEYRSRLDSLCPSEERIVDLRWSLQKMSGGVCAIIKDSVRLFTLGSASRGIPYKEWEIPLPFNDPEDLCFCPSADVIAFCRWQNDSQLAIYLRTLSDGKPHPAAQHPVIHYPAEVEKMGNIFSASITSSRLAILGDPGSGGGLAIFDWKCAQVIFESVGGYSRGVEFIDDHRLITTFCDQMNPPSLRMINTAGDTGGTPTETVFHMPRIRFPGGPILILEEGAHTPFPGGPSVPFHQDPAQRIIALWIKQHPHFVVIQVGALLQLAEGREGCEFMWDELGDRAIFPLLDLEYEVVRVSGCRLFFAHRDDDSGAYTSVYDFSAGGLAKYSSKQVDRTHDSATTPSKLEAGFQSGARYLSPTGASGQIPPDVASYPGIGYDNLLFTRFNGVPEQPTLHILGFS